MPDHRPGSRRLVRGALLGLALTQGGVACGSAAPGGDQEGADEGPGRPPPCEYIYGIGARVAQVVAIEETTGCLADGEPTYFELGHLDCADGRTLYWNDRGYGFTDTAWIEPDPDENPPAFERARCEGEP